MIFDVFKGFVILLLVFVPLEQVFSLHQQKILRREWATDTVYYFTGYFIGKAGNLLCIAIALLLTHHAAHLDLQRQIAAQPIGFQFIEALIVADIGYYFAHRLLHTVPWLWKFHTIHHSVEEMDWLATVRVHPVDQIFTKLLQMIPLYWLGFSAQTFAAYALFSAAIAFYIHSNLRLTAGPFKWVFATPEFHHWHHAHQPGVHKKNLAAQLPLMDWMFGTLYMPESVRPLRFGIPYSVPKGYPRQIISPFQQLIARYRRKRRVTNEQPASKKPSYLRPVLLLLSLALVSGLGFVGYAKAHNYSVKTTVYVFFAGFNTPKVSLTELEQGKVKPVVLVDVRDPEEYSVDHIGKSVSVPLPTIKNGTGIQKIQDLAKSSAKANGAEPTVVLYCQSGPRSIEAYQHLKKTGLNLLVLSGGIKEWRASIPPTKDGEVLEPISASTQATSTSALKK